MLLNVSSSEAQVDVDLGCLLLVLLATEISFPGHRRGHYVQGTVDEAASLFASAIPSLMAALANQLPSTVPLGR
jgi:hypothetical protein